jgi:hypothetical protein
MTRITFEKLPFLRSCFYTRKLSPIVVFKLFNTVKRFIEIKFNRIYGDQPHV